MTAKKFVLQHFHNARIIPITPLCQKKFFNVEAYDIKLGSGYTQTEAWGNAKRAIQERGTDLTKW